MLEWPAAILIGTSTIDCKLCKLHEPSLIFRDLRASNGHRG